MRGTAHHGQGRYQSAEIEQGPKIMEMIARINFRFRRRWDKNSAKNF